LTCSATVRSVTNSCCATLLTRVAPQGELPPLMVGRCSSPSSLRLRRAVSDAAKHSYARSRPAPTRLEGLAVSTRPGEARLYLPSSACRRPGVHVEADAPGARRGLGDKTVVFERLLASVKRRRSFKGLESCSTRSSPVLGLREARAVAPRVYPLTSARISVGADSSRKMTAGARPSKRALLG
jgi:hypothetical protein